MGQDGVEIDPRGVKISKYSAFIERCATLTHKKCIIKRVFKEVR